MVTNIIEVYTHPGPFDASRGEVIDTRILPKDGDWTAQNEAEKATTSRVERMKKEATRSRDVTD